MDHSLPIQFANPNRQQGAALFMALIVLLVLTILGVFGMNMARLENLMAGNTQFQTTALNNAEAVLAVGEDDVEKNVIGQCINWNNSDDDWYYDRTSDSLKIINPAEHEWTKFNYATIPADDADASSRYVVEYAGKYTDFKCSSKWGVDYADECRRFIFIVSAQNDASRGAKRTVQSVYVSAKPPC